MSRYLQQLARHAGLAPSPPPGPAPSPGPAAPPAGVAETSMERVAPATPPGDPPSAGHPATELPPGSAAPPPPALPVAAASQLAAGGIGPHPAVPAVATRPGRSRPADVPQSAGVPVERPAAAIIQQVVDWIARPERERAAAVGPEAPEDPASIPAAAIARPTPPMVEIAVAGRPPVAIAPAPAGPALRADQTSRLPAPSAVRADQGGAPEYQVSIGSIQVTIEPPPLPAPPPAPRAAVPPPRSTLPTRAYRHYLRPVL